jgi:hypothetical protein
MPFASVRLKLNCGVSETTEVRQEACLFFCKAADQQTEQEEQEVLEGSRNSLAESAGKPVACEGRFIPTQNLGQYLLKF